MTVTGDPRSMPAPPDWFDDALCAQIGSIIGHDLWHVDKGGNANPAKAICRKCPVQRLCLSYGMDQEFGIYGGYTAKERRALRHGRTCQICDAPITITSPHSRQKYCRDCAQQQRRQQQAAYNQRRRDRERRWKAA